jgi:hypothetical protein
VRHASGLTTADLSTRSVAACRETDVTGESQNLPIVTALD